ncbi:MAG: hypothetical protein FJ304_24900 [Planctomycetes bacterium]|nr:hypothetical protein [Planctomycetota bacterium]
MNYKIDEGVTFAEALNKLSQATGVTFVIRQDQFAANGVDDIQKMKMKPLTVNGQGLVVLDVLARQIKASYKVEKGVVVIAPKE